MVILSQFFRLIYLPLLSNGRYILLFILSSSLHSKILPFFNPIYSYKSNEVVINTQGFVANDAVSIREFSDEWRGDYTPMDGDNIMIESYRLDIGLNFEDKFYIGYFYNSSNLITTNRGFVDFFHTIKNEIALSSDKNYKLKVDINGITEQGVVLAKTIPIVDNQNHTLRLGLSAHISRLSDTQYGSISGRGDIYTNQEYDMDATIDYYYYNDNLIYKLDILDNYGVGYGLDLALSYQNRLYGFDIQFIGNNIFSHTKWNNLAFSYVDIKTDNGVFDKDNFITYNATISGIEKYKDFYYDRLASYHLNIKKYISDDIDLTLGLEKIDTLNIPYISISKRYPTKKIELIYESRFHSVGIKYDYSNYSFGIISNGLMDTSALSLSARYIYSW